MNQGDGVHPNAAGAKVLADNIWPYLLPMARAAQDAARNSAA
jgi:lysophospholipase L1-like esterase